MNISKILKQVFEVVLFFLGREKQEEMEAWMVDAVADLISKDDPAVYKFLDDFKELVWNLLKAKGLL